MSSTVIPGAKVIVITGSTRGIGFGLARAFLERGCAVLISGRSQEGVEQAADNLSTQFGSQRVLGFPCNVVDYQQVSTLWQAAVQHFSNVDIWINNAGIAHPVADFWTHSQEQTEKVVQTNLLGTMNGIQVAVNGMLTQGRGAIYNLEGLGSDGRIVDGLALYGSTKAAIRYLDRALAKQLKGKPVIMGAVAPGMVMTELVTSQFEGRPADFERFKPIFNIIAERVETVTPILARKILANRRNGALIRPFGPGHLLWKFIQAPFSR